MSSPEWTATADELPPADGFYQIADDLSQVDQGREEPVVVYDGYGFVKLTSYEEPKYWKKSFFAEKQYGKVLPDAPVLPIDPAQPQNA